MSHTPKPEKIAHLVISTTDVDKRTQHEHIQSFHEAHSFLVDQPDGTEIGFTWHYLDPELRRRLLLTCSYRAITLADTYLEISRSVVEAKEPNEPGHPVHMATFVLNTSGVFEPQSSHTHYIQSGLHDPDKLYTRYDTLRRRTGAQLGDMRALGGLNAPVGELRSGSPVA